MKAILGQNILSIFDAPSKMYLIHIHMIFSTHSHIKKILLFKKFIFLLELWLLQYNLDIIILC